MSHCCDHSAGRGVFDAEVLANRPLCRGHYLLSLAVEGFPPTRPGQFVQLQCRPATDQATLKENTWGPDRPPRFSQPELVDAEPFLRRPFSLAGDRRDGPRAVLELIYHVVGTGTYFLSELAGGETLSLLGPLGNAFDIDPDRPRAVLVGGGVGVPPMLYLAEALAAAGKSVVAICGARAGDLLPLALPNPAAAGREPVPTACAEEFAALGVESIVATDDGSVGFHGYASEALEAWLDASGIDPAGMVAYTCGPEPLMRAVAEIAARRAVPCQVAMERHMACGMGTCQSCVVKIRDHTPAGWSYKLCCTDGPVFDAADVLW